MRKDQAKLFLLGIPVLFLVGSLFHFLYEVSGELFIIGLLAPINESIFEHTKLFPAPAVLWYGLVYLFRRGEINADAWFTAALLSIVTHVFSMLFLYYFYTGAFALKSLAADITTFFIAVVLGQGAGLRTYRRGRVLDYQLALLLILAILMAVSLLTIAPPQLPLFFDPVTKTYGMSGSNVSR